MPLTVAIVVIVALIFLVWVAFAKEPGPAPADVAIAYERAWDALDFSLLYDLSGDELRDGMAREHFVTVKRAAYERTPHALGRLGPAITVEEVGEARRTALVVTAVGTDDGIVRNNIVLERRAPGWLVVGYSLRADPADA